jgi:hypothetical protein
VTLRLKRGFETPEEVVEGLPQLSELILWALHAETAVEIGGRDLTCGSVHGAKRTEESAGNPPCHSQRDRYGDYARDCRSNIELLPKEGIL